MAGFVDNNDPSQSPVIQRIRESVRKLSTFGMKYDDMVIRNSQAVGVTEAAFLNKNKANVEDESMLWTLAKQDITTKQEEDNSADMLSASLPSYLEFPTKQMNQINARQVLKKTGALKTGGDLK